MSLSKRALFPQPRGVLPVSRPRPGAPEFGQSLPYPGFQVTVAGVCPVCCVAHSLLCASDALQTLAWGGGGGGGDGGGGCFLNSSDLRLLHAPSPFHRETRFVTWHDAGSASRAGESTARPPAECRCRAPIERLSFPFFRNAELTCLIPTPLQQTNHKPREQTWYRLTDRRRAGSAATR